MCLIGSFSLSDGYLILTFFSIIWSFYVRSSSWTLISAQELKLNKNLKRFFNSSMFYAGNSHSFFNFSYTSSSIDIFSEVWLSWLLITIDICCRQNYLSVTQVLFILLKERWTIYHILLRAISFEHLWNSSKQQYVLSK